MQRTGTLVRWRQLRIARSIVENECTTTLFIRLPHEITQLAPDIGDLAGLITVGIVRGWIKAGGAVHYVARQLIGSLLPGIVEARRIIDHEIHGTNENIGI